MADPAHYPGRCCASWARTRLGLVSQNLPKRFRGRRHRVTRWSAVIGGGNRGLWQFYWAKLSELTVSRGPSRCQDCERQRVNLIFLPARVDLKRGQSWRMMRSALPPRSVSWVTCTAQVPHASIVSLRFIGGFERLHHFPTMVFHPPNQSLPIPCVAHNRATLFFAARR